jgi:hypothetical protein
MKAQAPIRPYLNQAYLLGLLMVAVGLTLSPFLMGMSQFWLVLVWLVDGIVARDFKQKLSRFWHNKAAVLLVALYLMHVVGLLWTSDFEYAMKDLRVKLPILVMPFVLSSMEPLDRKRFDFVLLVYVLSVFIATQFSFFRYIRHDYEDVREISRFISHIRFCLNIVFSMAVIGYYLYKRSISKGKGMPSFGIKVVIDQFLMWLLLFWFAYVVFIFESLSGYVILVAVVLATLLFAFLRWKKGRGWRIALGASALAVIVAIVVVVWVVAKPMLEVKPVDFSTLEKTTAQGNPYWHDTIHNPVEDGKYVGLYYNRTELREAWSQRSELPFDGTTGDGENLEATLARYLTSKDLRKDAEGVKALTDEDVNNIEQGVANYNNWKHPGLRARLSSTLFEYNLYRRYNNPNGGSLSQRIEYTRASFHIIGRHPWFGVGTGDVPQAFSQTYDEIHSPLKEEFRFRAHNQYLAIAVAFGLVGLAFFLFVLLYPWFASKRTHTYLNMVFLCIILVSMFPEDTLETQAGATLFAFFMSLLLFAKPQRSVDVNQ